MVLEILDFHMSYSSQVAVTKYYTLDGLNNRKFYFRILEAGKFRIKVPAR